MMRAAVIGVHLSSLHTPAQGVFITRFLGKHLDLGSLQGHGSYIQVCPLTYTMQDLVPHPVET